jgi:hypothetical protein
MGVWGDDNFENDAALDFLGRDVVDPLVAQMRRVLDTPDLADPEESTSYEIMAAVELLAILGENTNTCSPETQIVEDCRDVFLRAYDAGADKLEAKPGFKDGRRAVIEATFERLLRVCRKWDELRG